MLRVLSTMAGGNLNFKRRAAATDATRRFRMWWPTMEPDNQTARWAIMRQISITYKTTAARGTSCALMTQGTPSMNCQRTTRGVPPLITF